MDKTFGFSPRAAPSTYTTIANHRTSGNTFDFGRNIDATRDEIKIITTRDTATTCSRS